VARFFLEEFPLCVPSFSDELCWRESFEGLEPSGAVVGFDEQIQVSAPQVVVIVEIAFDCGLVDRPVHALDLTIRPRVVGFGQAVLCCNIALSQDNRRTFDTSPVPYASFPFETSLPIRLWPDFSVVFGGYAAAAKHHGAGEP
jgi:hypothetical protein